MGYVGTAMATLIASSKTRSKYQYFVTGIEQKNKIGEEISSKINSGSLSFNINDNYFKKNFIYATKIKKDLVCSTEIQDIKGSKIVIISIN